MVSDNIYQFIIDRLIGEESPEGALELDRWLAQATHHQQLYGAYEKLWHETRRLYRIDEPDLDSCLQRFESRCYPAKRKMPRWLHYAAVLAIPLMCSVAIYMFYFSKKSSELETLFVHNQNKVELVLANGEKIVLSEMSDRERLTAEGIRMNSDNNTLSYDSQSASPAASSLQYNVLSIPRGADYSLILSDGTKIFLNAESELRYPIRFTDRERKVFLKGEAYFDVARDTLKPFIVNTQQLDIEVLGTAFNVMAYTDLPKIETTLERGCVRVKSGENQLILHPGMQAVYQKDKATLLSQEVNTQLYTGWKDAKIIFEDLRLEDLLQKLSRWYDFNIFYLNSRVKDIQLTGSISKHEHISTILELLETMGKVKFTIHDRTVTVIDNLP